MTAYNPTMKITKSLFFIAALFAGLQAEAYKYIGPKSANGTDGSSKVELRTKAAGCAPAVRIEDLYENNVRALIETGGNMWQNRSTGQAAYYVPGTGDVSVLYAGALWMGGISPDQQLKLAAVRFRTEGNDFWTGPLTEGSAEIDAETCADYDKFYNISRADVEEHRRYFDCLADPECDVVDEFEEGYSIPSYFFDWPATYQGRSLAPWFDYGDEPNGVYDPQEGDYPWYDLFQEVSCFERTREAPIPLFGDYTKWWVFNDKGNIHTESQGQPIGMEILAQAFAFFGNDEINNMTFYNYTLINRGSTTLDSTYFGQWVDPDIGTSIDDYVGCDVQRGLGYAYNGDGDDESSSSSPGYGENPPAVGIDFFQGPFQDADFIDNPLTTNFSDAIDNDGIPYRGIGVGYGDNIVDNERFGMRKFLYYNNSTANNGEPSTALHYYNYMKGFWKNNQRMAYGGDGFNPGTGANLSQPADYMFPGDTDPFHWGTQGVANEPWTEQTSNNAAGDRRFIQSAGPFTLEPGSYNNITVGAVYARATGGEPFESVRLVRFADDKAQALFDNCFQVISGPDAPDVAIRELDREIILYLTNNNTLSNNFKENYLQFDPEIPEFLPNGDALDSLSRSYTFQGYQIYQLANSDVSISDLTNVDLVRQIAQVDVRDSVTFLVNYEFDDIIDQAIPKTMVVGENEGVRHSFVITDDAFATGNTRLINFKTYYFLVVAYGYNNFDQYNAVLLTGQAEQYKLSRKSAVGPLRTYSAIPHKVDPENGGTVLNSMYGSGIQLTKHEGVGNGLNVVDITPESEAQILAEVNASEVTYRVGAGPVDVRVVDPLRVPAADFKLRLAYDDADLDDPNTVRWQLINLTTEDTVTSSQTIDVLTEELILEWGLSVTWEQIEYADGGAFVEPINFSLSFDNPSQPWLSGVSDGEGFSEINWIRSGTQEAGDDAEPGEDMFDDFAGDEEEAYEGILDGTWTAFAHAAAAAEPEGDFSINVAPTPDVSRGVLLDLNNVDVVITSDKSKWTRCMVLEAQFISGLAQDADAGIVGAADRVPEKNRLRRHPSVDKMGRKPGDAGYNADEATLGGTQPVGMGWFPGYAIDLGTGQRLNMAFSEDSWLGSENGRDMLWNPSPRIRSNLGSAVYMGGQHWVYVFKDQQRQFEQENRMPSYDESQWAYSKLETSVSNGDRIRLWRSCTWVGSSLLNSNYEMLPIADGLIPNDVRIRLRVGKQYAKYSPTEFDTDILTGAENFWNPLYTFSTRGLEAYQNQGTVAESFMDNINIVPNPYYAFSDYETTKVDNRVKIVNLPEECTISIYSINGIMVRQFKKADPLTFLDWDLKNQNNVPISSGVYVIHIEAPGIGEKVLKWFGVMRPIDLDNF